MRSGGLIRMAAIPPVGSAYSATPRRDRRGAPTDPAMNVSTAAPQPAGFAHHMPRYRRAGSGLAHELRLQLHRADAVDLAVDVMVAFHKADVLDLGADLDHEGRALDLEILDHRDAVAVGQPVAVGVLHHQLVAFGGGHH